MKRAQIIVALCLWLTGCGVEVDDTRVNLKSASAAEVNAASEVLKVPTTTARADYLQKAFLDTHEYLHFFAPREVADEFAKNFLGFVPAASEDPAIFNDELGQTWWPSGPVAGARVGRASEVPNGIREVLILDGPEVSEVWAFYGSP